MFVSGLSAARWDRCLTNRGFTPRTIWFYVGLALILFHFVLPFLLLLSRDLKRDARRLRLVAMLDTLEYVRRSGRVSWARARLASLINLKPFIELREGNVYRIGESRTRNKGIARLLEMMESLGPLECLAILHTNAEAEASHLLEIMRPQVATPAMLVNVTTVIGTHVGPNGLGFVSVTL